MDFNLWQSLLFALILTFPFYLLFVTVGLLILFLISDQTKELPSAKYKRGLILRIAGIVLSVILLMIVLMM